MNVLRVLSYCILIIIRMNCEGKKMSEKREGGHSLAKFKIVLISCHTYSFVFMEGLI
jgi:hypothetical protein